MKKRFMLFKRGEGYIDLCVGVVAFVIILVIAINIFSFITLRVDLDRISDELIESATYFGCFAMDFNNRNHDLIEDYFNFDTEYGADQYYNTYYQRVQLGEKMWVIVSTTTYIKGLGVFQIPVTVSVKKSGLSEKYWK